MASIFTYDPDPPKVASPWLKGIPEDENRANIPGTGAGALSSMDRLQELSLHEARTTGSKVTRLQAEPQEGPVEYKLHLLLRPRRKFRSTNTVSHISGSRHPKPSSPSSNRSLSEYSVDPAASSTTSTPPAASTQQTRQHRLEQLTTQLLWRLQQSSPHHTSSATNIILPSLPEALPELQAPQQPAKLLHGLEESQGALYEIGVSDDGALVGLAEDEMHESLNNLRAMAACLGCTVEVLRMETVGDCEWIEEGAIGRKERTFRRTGKLVVVEALIKPHLQAKSETAEAITSETGRELVGSSNGNQSTASATEQLRITMTGPTMSGKSTLLGTMTTSTLDNGRGKSRLSMLKHRHEITSGVTSSVTQELLGYRDSEQGSVHVINYATENIASWIDIHVAAGENRIVFVSDSAGHPRYRRTTVRGLVGWKPHYTLLCIPADDTEDTAGMTSSTQASQQALDTAVTDVDLTGVQLALCLRLDLPLVIVVTKLDLASRTGLKGTLTKVLDALKAVGKKPAILPSSGSDFQHEQLHAIDAATVESAYRIALPLLNDARATVPIVLTSAVQGTGISNLHALLHELPIPTQTTEAVNTVGVLFHIEDVYSKPAEVDGVIVSGRMRSGRISIGECGVLGPFSSHELDDSEDSDGRPSRRRSSELPASRSFPGALRNTHLTLPHSHLPGQEWRRFKVISIRNLRLPVHTLETDQVGTIAIALDDPSKPSDAATAPTRIRKGMVLAHVQPQATRSFVAVFHREDPETFSAGNHVVVYVASVRASARVVRAHAPISPIKSRHELEADELVEHEQFGFEDALGEREAIAEQVAGQTTMPRLLVTFYLDASKELMLVGDQILVMPSGGPGLYGGHERGKKGIAGLEGFVGQITEIHS